MDQRKKRGGGMKLGDGGTIEIVGYIKLSTNLKFKKLINFWI